MAISMYTRGLSMRPPSEVVAGFTLVELMVVLAILSVLLALGVPSLQSFLIQRSVAAQADAFASALRYTRSEAIKSGQPATMCITANANDAAPTCLAAAPSNGWASGWLIFSDLDADGSVDSSDVLLRVEQSMAARSGGAASTNKSVTFLANGLAVGAQDGVSFTPPLPTSDSRYTLMQYTVCVASTGRARIVKGSSC